MVGKVELIFACALHTISVFFYLFIFDVRVPICCAECSFHAHGSGLGYDHPLVQVDVSQVWLAISSCLLGFVFVFGNSIRNLYEAVIFLFVVHPCAPTSSCRQVLRLHAHQQSPADVQRAP